jgi:hypothetical protein
MSPRRTLAVGAPLVAMLVVLRIIHEPVPVYGDSAAGWIEHMARLETALSLQRASASGPLELLRAADGLYPPALHLLALPVSLLTAHDPRVVAGLGLLWLAALAAAAGSIARRWSSGPVAALVVLLVPALHGVAARYYYDLPMVALVWGCAALVIRGGTGAGLAGAALFGLACLVKWSALPLGLPVVLGALVLAPPGRARLAVALALPVVVGGLLALDLPSFGAMGGASFQPPPGTVLSAAQQSLAESGPPGQALVMLQVGLSEGILGDRAGFYAARLLQSCLSPALGLVLLPALVLGVWHATHRERLAVLAATAPVAAFLLLLLPPLDERFLLGLLPLVALGSARGWAAAPSQAQRPGLALVFGVGLAVGARLHLGASLPPDQAPDAAQSGHTLPWTWSAGPSVDRRGWAPASASPSPRMSLRARLWEVLQACPWRRLGGRDRLITPQGDLNWWGHQLRLAALSGDPTWSWQPDGPGEVWLQPAPPGAWEPASPSPPGMVPAGTVRDPDGGPGILVWQQPSTPRCAAPGLAPPPDTDAL